MRTLANLIFIGVVFGVFQYYFKEYLGFWNYFWFGVFSTILLVVDFRKDIKKKVVKTLIDYAEIPEHKRWALKRQLG